MHCEISTTTMTARTDSHTARFVEVLKHLYQPIALAFVCQKLKKVQFKQVFSILRMGSGGKTKSLFIKQLH